MELLKGLTPRLADSQSNLKPLAASALAEVASSVGPDAAIKVQVAGYPEFSALLLWRGVSADFLCCLLPRSTTTALVLDSRDPTLVSLTHVATKLMTLDLT